jgi:hypothetical protein
MDTDVKKEMIQLRFTALYQTSFQWADIIVRFIIIAKAYKSYSYC